MTLFGGLTDFAMTPDGDIMVDGNDIKQTSGIEWFNQEVNKILKSGDEWYFTPNAGANLEAFYGQNNTREVGASIRNEILYKIGLQKLNYPAALDVNVVPISLNELKIYISVSYADQVYSITNIIFDLQNGNIRETMDIIENQSIVTPIKHPYASRFL